MAIDQATHRVEGLHHMQRLVRAVCGTRIGPIARLRAAGLMPCLVLALVGLSFAGVARVEAHAGHQHPGARIEKAGASQPSHATKQASSTVADRDTPAGPAASSIGPIEGSDGVQSAAMLTSTVVAIRAAAIAPVTSASVSAAAETTRRVDNVIVMLAGRVEQPEEAWLLLVASPVTATDAIEQGIAGSVADFLYEALSIDGLPAVAAFSGSQADNPLNHPCGAWCGACASCTSSSCCSGMLTQAAVPAVSPAGENAMRFTRAEAMQGGTVDPMPRPPNSASLI